MSNASFTGQKGTSGRFISNTPEEIGGRERREAEEFKKDTIDPQGRQLISVSKATSQIHQ
jgi:hypothetical protein